MKYTNMEKMWQETLINQPDIVQQMVQKMLQDALVKQFDKFMGADAYQRTETRVGQRNGTYERQLNTRVGMITLKVCRDRAGKFHTDLFDSYQRTEKALVLTVIQMYIDGVATRKVAKAMGELCGFDVSKSQVSELVVKLDGDLEKWRSRPLIVMYAYLMVDARYEKVRENGHVISKAFVTIIGITVDGMREIIGCFTINSESFEEWDSCFQALLARGLRGVLYTVSDENKGLKAALQKNFQGAQWQRCQVHYMRNLIGKLTKSDQHEAMKLLRDLFAAPSKNAALERLKPLTEFLRKQKKEPVAEWLEDSIEDTLAVYSLPEVHHKKMRSTNMLERHNEELKRRSRTVRIFPNEASCLRLLSAICLEVSEEWDSRRYLDM